MQSFLPTACRAVIVAINGYPRSGKDTFVEYATQRLNQCGWVVHTVSSIDFVKQITAEMGIPEEPKTPEKRALWSELKAAFERYDNFASVRTLRQIEQAFFQHNHHRQIGFIHSREPASIEFLQSVCEHEFMTSTSRTFPTRTDSETMATSKR